MASAKMKQDKIRETQESHYRFIQLTYAASVIVMKWMMGVLIYKLVNVGIEASQNTPSEPSQPLLRLVFLFNLSFYSVLGLAIGANSLNVFASVLLETWSAQRSVNAGRKLRREILEKAVTASGGVGGADVAKTATEIIVKVKVIENFIAFDQRWILVDTCIVMLSFSVAIVFAWFSGVAAVGCFAASYLWKMPFEKQRQEPLAAIETNEDHVNARLLDVIKNGVKIKIMGQLDMERKALSELEQVSDAPRATDTKLKALGRLGREFWLILIPLVMALIGWAIIQNSDSDNAVDLASSILISTMLMDEVHKALLELGYVSEKKIGFDEAQAAVDNFLGNGTAESSDENEDTQHSDSEEGQCLAKKHGLTRNLIDQGNDVHLERIVLRYPGRDHPVLNHYSHLFERGKIHALVGESGSGKSTALKVVADLIQPESGRIQHWNGMKVAYVSQDQMLFARTIRENVAYGADKDIGDEQVWTALKTATMDKWVRSLPDGLDQLLTNGEAGVSGGQLQRLNLVHLFCACQDADLIILDEVLSALDPKSRALLLDRLGTFLHGKTALIITHHAEMLEICDNVHEMASPKFVENQRPSIERDSILQSRRRRLSSISLQSELENASW